MPRTGFELATTSECYRNKDLFEDLENFKLFARAKLNLGKETVCNYVQRIQAFLRDRTIVTNRDVQAYINEKKEICVPDYVSNIISAFKASFGIIKGCLSCMAIGVRLGL